jgi:hypothetical protein
MRTPVETQPVVRSLEDKVAAAIVHALDLGVSLYAARAHALKLHGITADEAANAARSSTPLGKVLTKGNEQ